MSLRPTDVTMSKKGISMFLIVSLIPKRGDIMALDIKKAARLTRVARLYYEEKLTQNEIAQEMNVSRPMVSKLLAEAHEQGIVAITINETGGTAQLEKNMCTVFGLSTVVILPDNEKFRGDTDARLARASLELLRRTDGARLRLGIGWGEQTSRLVTLSVPSPGSAFSEVVALSGAPADNNIESHCNGHCFALAERLGAVAHPVFLPFRLSTPAELEELSALDYYNDTQKSWDNLDHLAIEILPSHGDDAGSFLSYGFNAEGTLRKLPGPFVCASGKQMSRAKNILLLAHSNNDPATLLAALKCHITTQIVLTSGMAQAILKLNSR